MYAPSQHVLKYFEEAEMLWIAGSRPLRIVSIVIARTAKNYRKMMHSLYLFDAMISGVKVGSRFKMKIGQTECDLIANLINLTLQSGDIGSSVFDDYLEKEWDLFVQNRRHIILDLFRLDEYFQSLSQLIMFSVEENGSSTVKGKDNVIRPEWISMFPSLETVTIITAGDWYMFRLEALLDSLSSIPNSSVTFAVFDDGEWAENALSADVSSAFNAAGWKIEYDEEFVVKVWRGRVREGKGGLVIKSVC